MRRTKMRNRIQWRASLRLVWTKPLYVGKRSTVFAPPGGNSKPFAQVKILLLALWVILTALPGSAQDARESLGPKDKPAQAKGPHPLTQLMTTLNSSLRPELRGKHPRVYVTDEGIVKLRERARATHRDLWQRALRQVR